MGSKRHSKKQKQTPKKSAPQDEFFEIDEGQPWAHWRLHVLCGIICIIFAWWVWMLNPTPVIHGDQMNIVTMVLSKQHPENFTRDPAWSGRIADLYPPLPQAIIAALIGRFGVIGGHRVVQFPLSIAYLFVMYGTLYYLTRSVPAALLVALASVIWRWSMGETYWGLDRLPAVQPRSFAIIFMPVLFICIWKLRNSWWLLLPFFIAGLVFNINPPSALFFVSLSLFSLFLVILFDRSRISRLGNKILPLICAGLVFVAGALPYIYINRTVSSSIGELSGQALQERMNALQYFLARNPGYFPFPARMLVKPLMFGFAVPLFLATIAWCLRKERRNGFDRWLVCFLLLAFIGPVAAQYLNQKIFTVEPILPNCMRGQKFAYLILYIYIAWLLAELLRRFTLRERCTLIMVSALIVTLMPLFGNNPDDPWGQWSYNKKQMETLLRGEKVEIAGWHQIIAQVSAWARQNTPKDSLFLFAHRFMDPFRIYALRGIVYSQLSAGVAQSAGPDGLPRHVRFRQEVEWITSRKDVSRLLKLADESGADFIVVPQDFPKVTGWPLAISDRFWRVYKKP